MVDDALGVLADAVVLLTRRGGWLFVTGLVGLFGAIASGFAGFAVFAVVLLAAALALLATTSVVASVGVRLDGDVATPGSAPRGAQRSVQPAVAPLGTPLHDTLVLDGVAPAGFGLRIVGPLPARLGGESRLFVGGDPRRRCQRAQGALLPPAPRGVHRRPSATLIVEDLLGLTGVVVGVTSAATCKVLPAPRTVHGASALWSSSTQPDDELVPRPRPREDLLALRPWVTGDDARRIHWRQSVRAGEWIVRTPEHDPAPRREVQVVLDTFAPAGLARTGDDEAALHGVLDAVVDTALGVARALRAQGHDVVLVAALSEKAATGDVAATDRAVGVRSLPGRTRRESAWRDLGARASPQSRVPLQDVVDARGDVVVVTAALGVDDDARVPATLPDVARWSWRRLFFVDHAAGSDEHRADLVVARRRRDKERLAARAAARRPPHGGARRGARTDAGHGPAGDDDDESNDQRGRPTCDAEGGISGGMSAGGAAAAEAAVRRAYVVYGAAVLSGTVALVVVDGKRWSAEAAEAVAGIGPGFAVGAACARACLRGWVFVIGSYLVGVAAVVLGGALDLTHSPQRMLVALGGGASWGATSSFRLLAPRADLWALWLPMGLHVAAAGEWLNHRGGVAAGRQDRLGLWDGTSTLLVVVVVAFFIATVAARQAVSRTRWPRRPVRAEAPAPSGAHRGRATLLVVVLALAGLLVTPFLLRTRPAPVRASPDASTTTPTASTPPSSPSWRPPDADALVPALQRIVAALPAVGDDAVKAIAGGAAVGGAAAAGAASSSPGGAGHARRVAAAHRAGAAPLRAGAGGARRGGRRRRRRAAGAARAGAGRPRRRGRRRPKAVPGLRDAVAVWERVTFRGRGLPDDAEERMAAAMVGVVAWAEARRTPWQAWTLCFTVPTLPHG